MCAGNQPIRVRRSEAIRLWLHLQGLLSRRGTQTLNKSSFTDHLERTGALQVDSVNVLERAHHLTLWSRFGSYRRGDVDRWVYQDRAAYEYWGHEASILPISHLPLGRRRMRAFPPEEWKHRSWWSAYDTSVASRRRVLRRLRAEGPLESSDFAHRDGEQRPGSASMAWLPREDKRTLKLLWHDGRVAISSRRHFRCAYDIADRVYPPGPIASTRQYHDHWLLAGLAANGVASERHLTNYFTAPALKAAARKRVIQRNLASGVIREVSLEGLRGSWYVLPEHLELLGGLPAAEGTTLVCPFDSLLWQRKRAADLLDFDYTIEIYVPAAKRRFGYYVMPILHEGRFVGRVDPKLHRDEGMLELRSVHLEPGFRRSRTFEHALRETIQSLSGFLGAESIRAPRGWRLG